MLQPKHRDDKSLVVDIPKMAPPADSRRSRGGIKEAAKMHLRNVARASEMENVLPGGQRSLVQGHLSPPHKRTDNESVDSDPSIQKVPHPARFSFGVCDSPFSAPIPRNTPAPKSTSRSVETFESPLPMPTALHSRLSQPNGYQQGEGEGGTFFALCRAPPSRGRQSRAGDHQNRLTVVRKSRRSLSRNRVTNDEILATADSPASLLKLISNEPALHQLVSGNSIGIPGAIMDRTGKDLSFLASFRSSASIDPSGQSGLNTLGRKSTTTYLVLDQAKNDENQPISLRALEKAYRKSRSPQSRNENCKALDEMTPGLNREDSMLSALSSEVTRRGQGHRETSEIGFFGADDVVTPSNVKNTPHQQTLQRGPLCNSFATWLQIEPDSAGPTEKQMESSSQCMSQSKPTKSVSALEACKLPKPAKKVNNRQLWATENVKGGTVENIKGGPFENLREGQYREPRTGTFKKANMPPAKTGPSFRDSVRSRSSAPTTRQAFPASQPPQYPIGNARKSVFSAAPANNQAGTRFHERQTSATLGLRSRPSAQAVPSGPLPVVSSLMKRLAQHSRDVRGSTPLRNSESNSVRTSIWTPSGNSALLGKPSPDHFRSNGFSVESNVGSGSRIGAKFGPYNHTLFPNRDETRNTTPTVRRKSLAMLRNNYTDM